MTIALVKPIIEIARPVLPAFLQLARSPHVRWKLSCWVTRIRRRISRLWHKLAMWVVGRLAPLLAQSYENRRPPALKTYGRYIVVGLRYHDGIAKAGEQVSLVRERSNKWDRNAIRVYNSNDEGVGYIARGMAAKLAPMMDMGARVYGRVLGKADRLRLLIEVLEG